MPWFQELLTQNIKNDNVRDQRSNEEFAFHNQLSFQTVLGY